MKRMLKMHETSIILLLLIYIAIVEMINPSFIQFSSLSLLMKSSVILVVLAIGQSFVLFTKKYRCISWFKHGVKCSSLRNDVNE